MRSNEYLEYTRPGLDRPFWAHQINVRRALTPKKISSENVKYLRLFV